MHFITVTAAFIVGLVLGLIVGLVWAFIMFLPSLISGKSEDEIARTLSSSWNTNPSDPFNLQNSVNQLH